MTAAPSKNPDDVHGLLRTLLAEDPGRPRLTWYGPGGERVELSARVLENWVAKTANLIVDELDAGPGSLLLLDLPPHWRTVTWLLATWSVGACAVLPGNDGPEPDAVISTDPSASGGPGLPVVAVALPALATSFGPELPRGAIDAAAAVRSHPDLFVPLVRPAPGDPALYRSPDPLPHTELLARAGALARRAGYPDRVRLLTGSGLEHALRDWLGPMLLHGSVVLHHDLAGLDPASRDRLADQEGVTARSARP